MVEKITPAEAIRLLDAGKAQAVSPAQSCCPWVTC